MVGIISIVALIGVILARKQRSIEQARSDRSWVCLRCGYEWEPSDEEFSTSSQIQTDSGPDEAAAQRVVGIASQGGVVTPPVDGPVSPPGLPIRRDSEPDPNTQNASSSPASTPPLTSTTTTQLSPEALAQAVKEQFSILQIPVENELRKIREVGKYSAIFENAFVDVICRFGAIDGTIGKEEAQLYLAIIRALHSKSSAKLGLEAAVNILQIHLEGFPELRQRPVAGPMLIRFVRDSDRANQTHYARGLGRLLYEVAEAAARADGNFSQRKIEDLDALRIGFGLEPPLNDNAPAAVGPNDLVQAMALLRGAQALERMSAASQAFAPAQKKFSEIILAVVQEHQAEQTSRATFSKEDFTAYAATVAELIAAAKDLEESSATFVSSSARAGVRQPIQTLETTWREFSSINEGRINGAGLMPFLNAARAFMNVGGEFLNTVSAALTKAANLGS
jgi:hypothetical protein